MQFTADEIHIVTGPAVVGHKGPQRLNGCCPAVITAVNKGLVACHLRLDLICQTVDFIQDSLIGERTFEQLGRAPEKAILKIFVFPEVGKHVGHLHTLDIIAVKENRVVEIGIGECGVQIVEHEAPAAVILGRTAKAEIPVGEILVCKIPLKKDPVDQAVEIYQRLNMCIVFGIGHVVFRAEVKNIQKEVAVPGRLGFDRDDTVLADTGKIGIVLFVELFGEGVNTGVLAVQKQNAIAIS